MTYYYCTKHPVMTGRLKLVAPGRCNVTIVVLDGGKRPSFRRCGLQLVSNYSNPIDPDVEEIFDNALREKWTQTAT